MVEFNEYIRLQNSGQIDTDELTLEWKSCKMSLGYCFERKVGMDMTKQESMRLFHEMNPDFFERESIRNMSDKLIYDEMALSLSNFEPYKYNKTLDENISFGYYQGDISEMKKAVERVNREWTQYFTEKERVYCGYIDAEIASFCLISNMGVYDMEGRKVKVGGPGCVGTLPEYRDRGIGLTMVKHVTEILKEEGYDYSYIHFTGVAPWYEKLGYKTLIRWTAKGIL